VKCENRSDVTCCRHSGYSFCYSIGVSLSFHLEHGHRLNIVSVKVCGAANNGHIKSTKWAELKPQYFQLAASCSIARFYAFCLESKLKYTVAYAYYFTTFLFQTVRK